MSQTPKDSTLGGAASKSGNGYRKPSALLRRAVEAPANPVFRPNLDDSMLCLTWSTRFLRLKDLQEPEVRLAGLRFHPKWRCSLRQNFIEKIEFRPRSRHKLGIGIGLGIGTVVGTEVGPEVEADGGGLPNGPSQQERFAEPLQLLGLPSRYRLAQPSWSYDGSKMAFVLLRQNRCELWVADLTELRVFCVSQGRALQGAAGFDFCWSGDGNSLLALMVAYPAKRSGGAQSPSPVVWEHSGGVASSRTYQDLLKTEQDCQQLERLVSSIPCRVPLDGSDIQELAPAGLYYQMQLSPDGQHLLLDQICRPFSFSVPLQHFPRKSFVCHLQTQQQWDIRYLPLHENISPLFDSVRPGRRYLQWRGDAAATLCWVESLDGGDSTHSSEFRDQLFLADLLAIPPTTAATTAEPGWSKQDSSPLSQPGTRAAGSGEISGVEWVKLQARYGRVCWGRGDLAVVEEHWWKTRWSRRQIVQPDRTNQAGRVIMDRCWEDTYNDPGNPLLERTASGRYLLVTDEQDALFLIGEGASPSGKRPFLDRLDWKNQETTRLFQSSDPNYQRPYKIQPARGEIYFVGESRKSPANLFVHRINAGQGAPQQLALTHFEDQCKFLRRIQKEILTYQRADGVPLSATLYYPQGQKNLPLLLWVYPGEVKNAALAGQVDDSPYLYLRPFWGAAMLFALCGYAVLEYPTFPIVGEGEQEPNDTYVEQLVASAQAAVDMAVQRGLVDRDRCAVGGHSYGAFTAANLMAHSQIFRTAIARSGAYNRTLTPFGFQSEERTYWQAKDVYHRLSPFEHADKITGPMLLIHGADDNNSGTHSMQSERFFQALKGLGLSARLVMLPHESHSYQAIESVLHTLGEMEDWLRLHLNQPVVE